MKVKKYQASSYRDALAQVRQDLGPDAVILTTREISRSRFLGIGRRRAVEIVAAQDIRLREGRPDRHDRGRARPRAPERARPHVSSPAISRDPQPLASATPSALREPFGASSPAAAAAAGDPATRERLEELERHLSTMRVALDAVVHPAEPTAPVVPPLSEPGPELGPLYRILCEADVSPALAAEIVLAAGNGSGGDGRPEAVRAQLVERLVTSGPIGRPEGEKPRVVALVGPTGVGKTTTIAKLAGEYTFMHNCRVGLLTVDTYRVAAVEQLRTFAKIMTVPVQVAASPREARECLDKFTRPELILVDTAGRSQKHDEQVRALQKLLAAVEPDEVHLVLSATTKSRDLIDVVKRFREVGVDRMIFTKLDETNSYGPVLNVAVESGLPISYVTNGQMVPEDIALATPGYLADLVMGGRTRDA
ncbi:MAG TPA: flagellar biosynthesis protein FlhF [Armatimonadota bacterium]|nr:flagellar biosynthesis protein FlhF [Armatimonadota bacterium]HQK95458.1 flagellar biosynthesis protein FlhF [Armatimonadota bacterium]